MPQRADAALVLLPETGPRWSIPGGEQDDESLTLHVATAAIGGTPGRRWRVRIPLVVTADGELEVGTPHAEEA